MSIFSEWNDDVIMFKFSEEENLQVPLYTEVVDVSWNPPDLNKIVDYLRHCPVITAIPVFDPIKCPICGEIIEKMTSAQQSSGVPLMLHAVDFLGKSIGW